MKTPAPDHSVPPFDPAFEARLRTYWQQSRQATPEPSAETLAGIQRQIQVAASKHARSHRRDLLMVIRHWQPLLAAAASLLLLAGAGHLYYRNLAPPPAPNERVQVDPELTAELLALDTIVWDTLAELEQNTLNQDLML